MDKEQIRLTSEEDWNKIWGRSSASLSGEPPRHAEKLKKYVQNVLGSEKYERIFQHSENSFWSICSEFLPKKQGLKILEIGSAPGLNLVKFNQKFGYVPYGVEYSKIGAELNRNIFLLHNLDADHVIHADLFSEEFQAQYGGYFDLVVSRGFIEHFSNPREAIEKHSSLLKEGGICVITIPSLPLIKHILGFLLCREVLEQHNLTIREKGSFGELFKATDLAILFLDYYGIVDLTFPLVGRKYQRIMIRLLYGCQAFLSCAGYLLFKEKDVKSRVLSPFLICIAKKQIDHANPSRSASN